MSDKPLSSEGASDTSASGIQSSDPQYYDASQNACTMNPPGSVNVTIQTEILESGFDYWQPGMKSTQSLTVDSQTGLPLFPEARIYGTTHIPTKGDVTGGGSMDSLSAVIDGLNVFSFSGSVHSAALSGLTFLTIDYHFSISYDPATGHGWLSGTHDGYPSSRISVNGQQIYNYYQGWNMIPTLIGKTGDVSVNRGF